MGNSLSERTAAANFILEVPAFGPGEEPDLQPARGLLKDKEIVLINTPDLLHPTVSQHKLTEHVELCVRHSAPGPHVFLLVLQPEDFTEEHRLRLCRVLKLFSDTPFDHSLVLISTPKKKKSGFMEKFRLHPPLKHMIKLCRYRFLWRENLEHSELFSRLVQVLKENNGEHVKRDTHQ
ncbi:GTPase IMAP family member 2-like [Stegastes partitus]|uniref:GTPase IMAP family member 2-like n=1 Tax=Stegastes partitus TaxID=144197 RepID=A0A9Y4NSV4_9TELE|nr:PREDICTED: GTPase IMAP family member 2-like [Stegastes partitus]